MISNEALDPAAIDLIRAKIKIKHKELAETPADLGLKPLQIGCKMASCAAGRHSLDHSRVPRKGDGKTEPGHCRDCGAKIVDLPGVGGRTYNEADEIVSTLVDQQHELIRAHYWKVPIDRWAWNQALRLGRERLRIKVDMRVRTAMQGDGHLASMGAPYAGDIVAYAQHATATCCRRCAAYWHGLPPPKSGEMPTEAQLEHVVTLALAYTELRLPELPDAFTPNVPAIRRELLLGARQIAQLDDQVADAIVAGTDPAGLVVAEGTGLQLLAARSKLEVLQQLHIDIAIG